MPEGGALDARLLVEALLASAAANGTMTTRGERVTEVLTEAGSVVGVRTATETVPSGAVVIAAGAWSGQIGGLPRPLSVEPIRGQMVAVGWPDQEPPAVIYAGSGYVIQRGNEAVAGTTMEHVGFSTATTKAAVDGLMDSVYRVYPALRGTSAAHKWAGLRPMTPDGNPIVGPDPEIPNLFYATGHGQAGIMLGTLTGEIVLELVLGHELEYDLTPLDPQRFWDL